MEYSSFSNFASPTTADISSSPRQLTIGALSNGTSYYFRVLARNTVGSGSYSPSSSAVTPATSPGIPSNLRATESDGALTLSWTAPSDGGAAIIDYTVQYSTSSVFATYQSALVTGGATSTSLTGLTNGTSYYFKVKARNSLGSGANSSASSEYVPRALRTLSIDASSYSATYVMTETPPTITATASAGSGVMSFLTSTAPVCTVGSLSGVVAFVSAGICSISASVAQSGGYLAADSSPISFTIGIGTQTVSWSPTTAVLTTQSPLTPSVAATSSGDGVISYAVTSAGTTGCSVNASSGVLTYSAAGSCVVRATAAATARYSAVTADVTFVVSLAAPAFTLSSSFESKAQNTAITGYTISSTGGAIVSYSISPSAPTGTSFSTSTGLLSGTPTTVQSATVYTITATNATSSASQTFTLTVTAPAPASCADGGVCVVGNTGPGGGIVSFVSGSNFTSTGSSCDLACRYIEVAPDGWSFGITVQYAKYSSDRTADFISVGKEVPGNRSIDPLLSLCGLSGSSDAWTSSAARGTAIGTGKSNTLALITAGCNQGAMRHLRIFNSTQRGNGLVQDWHIPSRDETKSFSYSNTFYWSSTQSAVDRSMYMRMSTLLSPGDFPNYFQDLAVRPIRVFGPTS